MTKTLTEDQMDDLYNAAHTVDGEIVTDYSGRGMFGAECVGIILNDDCALFTFARLLDDDLAELLGNPRWDNMGLREIAYWPNVAHQSADATV
ncbi:uncharacterized protein METZ01_LOCUS340532 [marine metagenome]|uniref:Uncharacterized protein n=1 Tax=marine metagenome TaxID=408172 RepID=A0A382QS07_9ZZZZ